MTPAGAEHGRVTYREPRDAHVHTSQDTLDLSGVVPNWRVAVFELFA